MASHTLGYLLASSRGGVAGTLRTLEEPLQGLQHDDEPPPSPPSPPPPSPHYHQVDDEGCLTGVMMMVVTAAVAEVIIISRTLRLFPNGECCL